MPMASQTIADDRALQHIEGREQSGSAVALVVMGHRPAAPTLHGQARLAALQSLDLTFLVHAQHQRLVRRVEIQAHHIAQLLHEAFIAGELEGPGAVGLQPVGIPDALDGGVAEAMCLRHRPRAPVGSVSGLAVQRRLHYYRHLVGQNSWLAAAAGRFLHQCLGTTVSESLAPLEDIRATGVEAPGDGTIGHSLMRQQYDPAAQHDFLRRVARPHPGLQGLQLLVTHLQRRGWFAHDRQRSTTSLDRQHI